MSDETTGTDGWGPVTPGSGTEASAPQAAAEQAATSQAAPEKAGFCQDCGRPLTRETVRAVGTGVFCEPCLEARIGARSGTQQPGAPPVGAPQPPYSPVPPLNSVSSSEPSPGLAALLGLIPGVGAMYNGQFAKGVIHLIIFAVLVSMSDNVNGIFGLFVFGWVCYMAIEAHHTAKARLEGLPLPNPFGFNDIGERMGFSKNWPGGTSGAANWGSVATPPAGPAAPRGAPTSPPTAANAGPNWVGYVPPTSFASAPPISGYAGAATYPPAGYPAVSYPAASYAPPAYSSASFTAPVAPDPAAEATQAQAMRDAGYNAAPPYAVPHSVPFNQTFSGAAVPAYGVSTPVDIPAAKRFPVGALWLIGLGAFILLANLVPNWRLGGRWLLPILFAGLAVWTLTRRLRSGLPIACLLRWPLILMVLAVLFALQAAYLATLGQTWPVLFIALGAVLLLERTAGGTGGYAMPVTAPAASFGKTGYTSVVPRSEPGIATAAEPVAARPNASAGDAAPARATWAAADQDPTRGES